MWQWDAVDLAKAIRLRKISSREATKACLERLDAVNPKLNAITFQIAEQALRDADAADAAVKAGEALGPLHGVPVSTKENIDQKDLPTPNGVVAYKDVIAPADSPRGRQLAQGRRGLHRPHQRAGLFAALGHRQCAARPHLQSRGPRARTPGGSSGGAGAAVASGIGPISHGNDYGGSIRYPAYCCGVAGIRPTMGRVPAFNPSATGGAAADHRAVRGAGPAGAARCKDVRLGLHAMSGRDRARSLVGAGASSWPRRAAPDQGRR